MKRRLIIALLLILLAVTIFFVLKYKQKLADATLPEQSILQLPLSGPLASPFAEISGLAWYQENLILLPQYPNRFDDAGDGFLFYIPKDEILAYVNGQNQTPLEPRPIQLVAPGFYGQIARYQGFEAIGFSGENAFLTIESGRRKDNMLGYIISGSIAPDLSTLTLDTTKLTRIPPQTLSENHTDEALLVLKDRVITFYEINGKNLNANPVAHVFDFDLEPQGTIPMDNIEYRVTDAALDSGNRFWVLNYFFPGEIFLSTDADPIFEAFGTGPTHVKNLQVERILQFQYSEDRITWSGKPPVLLELDHRIRNWEGLVLLDESGFLIVTDKLPTTLLAFVRMPE
jgi:hypothetical protein